jgi:hypothetical protein
MRRLARASILVLAAAALAGCGSDAEREAPAPEGGSAASTRLAVEVTSAQRQPMMMALTCGADKPCDRAAIRRLRAALRAAEDPDRVCTLQYGGPEEAHVTGTLEGRPIDVTLTRANGCGIAGYEALFTAFGRTPPLAG